MRKTKMTTGEFGNKIELNEYLTYGEQQQIQKKLKEADNDGGNEDFQKFCIELVVVSVDGEKENIYQKIKELPAQDVVEIFQDYTKKIEGLTKKK